MLQRALGSGWGVLLPGILLTALAFVGLPAAAWRGIIVVGLLLTCAMLWHHRLRHFVLLPSALALTGGVILMVVDLKLME